MKMLFKNLIFNFYNMHAFFLRIRRIAFQVMNELIPKKKKIVIVAFPDFDDTTKACCQAFGEVPIVVLVEKNSKDLIPSWLSQPDVRVEVKKSVRGLYEICSAKVLLYTHGISGSFSRSKRQLVINLWHGMPLKKIGKLDGKADDYYHEFSFTVATTEVFAPIVAKSFGVGIDKVLIMNLPRNEVFLDQTKSTQITEDEVLLGAFHVWLPTYRKSKIGDVRSDGQSGFVTKSLLEELDEILSERNERLVLKPHPMSCKEDWLGDYSNVKVIDDAWLLERSLTLYELLAKSRSLWTDYSSVLFDYLITGKPILLIAQDVDEYASSRGFNFPMDTVFGDTIIKTRQELVCSLRNGEFLDVNREQGGVTSQFVNATSGIKRLRDVVYEQF